MKQNRNRPAAECIYTPVPGSRSCRNCPLSLNPERFDPGCGLPDDLYEIAVHGGAVDLTPEVLREVGRNVERYHRIMDTPPYMRKTST